MIFPSLDKLRISPDIIRNLRLIIFNAHDMFIIRRKVGIMDKTHIMKKEIANLNNNNVAELKAKFAEYFGFDSGVTNARNLRARLTYKLQEIFLGGLYDEDRAILDTIADKDPIANLKADSNKKRTLIAGARLCRDWKGKTYEVLVRDDGKFEFEGALYRSLSAIACKITGTHWNGKNSSG